MNIGGHSFREHLSLLAPLFGFITAVWLLRLILDLAGASITIVHAASVTGAAALAVLLATLLIHLRRFGSYVNVVEASFLLAVWGQLLIVVTIIFSVATGIHTVYTLPEFSVRGDDPYHLQHIIGHLTFVVGIGTLFGAAMGCFLLWLLRRLMPVPASP